MRSSTLRHKLLTVMLVAASAQLAHADNPASTNTTTSQGLSVTITAPAGPLMLDGSAVYASTTASLLAPPPIPVNVLYVTDLSGSMMTQLGVVTPDNDCNLDGRYSRLDDACSGLIALNSAIGGATNADVGMIGFADRARNADMDPAADVQVFTSPADVDRNSNGTPDVDEVITGIDLLAGYAFTLFTPVRRIFIGTGTNYENALIAMNETFAGQPADEINIAAFISDGVPNNGNYLPALSEASQAGTTVYTFAVGLEVGDQCGLDQPLGIIANDTGGTCTVVTDTSTLESILPAVLTTRIQSLDLRVNGTLVASTTGSEPMTMSLSDIDINSYLADGNNQLTSTAIAEDGTSVTADTNLEAISKIQVQVDVKPGNSVNPVNIGSKGVITAAVLGSADFDVQSILVDSVLLGSAPISARKKGTLMMDYRDVNGDGYVDLLAKFNTQDLGLTDGDTLVTLTGSTTDGGTIEGSDSVTIVPEKSK